jgi:hypothetical protein
MFKLIKLFLAISLVSQLTNGQEMTNGLFPGGIAVYGGVVINNGNVYNTHGGAWEFQTKVNETHVLLTTINLASGGEIRIDWGDGNTNTYTGNNSNITKNYTLGQYTIKMYCNDWSKVSSMEFAEDFIDDLTDVNFSNLTGLSVLNIPNNEFTGTVPIKQKNTRWFSAYSNYFNNYDTALYTDATLIAQFSNNNITDSLLIGEIYEDMDAGITAPSNDISIDTRGTNMGTLPYGESNPHLISLKAKFAAVGKTLIYYYQP